MITLTGQSTFERFNVYRDDENPLQFYYMPQGPLIALDENGKPMFSLIMYRRDLSNIPEADRATKLGGGILAISVELSASDDEKTRLRAQLAKDPAVQAAYASGLRLSNGRYWSLPPAPGSIDPAKVAQALILGMVPIAGGNVQIQIMAEDGTKPGDFVTTLVGAGSVSMTGNERASCMAKLTMDGAAMVWTAMEKDLKVIRVAYTLNFNYRIVGLVVDAWCDARKAFNALHSQMDSMSEQASFLDSGGWHTYDHSKSTTLSDVIRQAMSASEFSGVTVTPSAPADVIKPEYIQALEKSAEDQITQFIAATFTDYKPGADVKTDDPNPDIQTELPKVDDKKYGGDYVGYYSMKTWDDSMSATFHYHLSEQSVVSSQLAPNDNLSNVLDGQNVNDYRTQISLDSAFYKYLDVMVVCTADFDNDPISLVKAHLSYAADGPQGPINQVGDYVFQKGAAAEQRFSTYIASVDKQSYDYQYDIHYKGTDATYTVSGRSNETVLVLDADHLGVLKVDVQLGVVDWDQIRAVVVTMTYGGGADRKATEFTLDSTHQSHSWVEVVGHPVTDPYTWSAVFVDKSDQRIPIPPTQQQGSLVINQPIGQSLDVTLVAVGTFGGQGLIEQIGVALKYADDANKYYQNTSLMLTREGDVKEWKIPLVDDKLRTYQYQVTVFYTGGVTRTDDWRTTDSTILPSGDPFGFKVTVLPYLLKGTPWAFGTLKVSFDDPQTQIHAEDTLQITDYTAPLTWRFRLGAVDRHTYHYLLSLYQTDNTSYASADSTASDAVLVLRPPAPPAQTPA
jgi:hypothetical protein